jgi:UDP-glucuronate 4-epimerase
MIVLITGVAGFIGFHIAKDLLKTNHVVIGIDNFYPNYEKSIKDLNISDLKKYSNFSFVEMDIRNFDLNLEKDSTPDIVLHLAALPGIQKSSLLPNETFSINTLGTINILEFCRKNSINKLIFSSSSSIYGNSESPFHEELKNDHLLSPYAISKKSAELILKMYHSNFQMNIIVLRLFSVYGDRQRPDLVIQKFSKLINSDEPITIYGDGSSNRDFTHIDDIVFAFSKSIDYLTNFKGFEIFNIGNSNPISLNELVDFLYNYFQKSKNIIYKTSLKEEALSTNADISKAKLYLNYSPKINFKFGLYNFLLSNYPKQ